MSVCSLIQTDRQSYHSTRYQLSQITPLKNMLQMNYPQNFRLYDPTTWNPDQERFNFMLRLHTRLWKFFQQNDCCDHHWHVNITLPFASIFWVGSLFLIQFDSPFLIWLSFVDSIWLVFQIWLTISYLTQLSKFKFTHNFWFNLTQFFDLIWLQLYPLYSPFLIWFSFYDSIRLIIYQPIKFSFLVWFDTHCTHLNRRFRFDSYILVQF